MRDSTAFTDAANRAGGFHELALEIGDRDDERLHRAATALWRETALTGCYPGADREPSEQDEVPVGLASPEEFGHLRSTVRTPLGGPVVCGCFATGIEDGARRGSGSGPVCPRVFGHG
ncbi:hypothetical protein AB0G02_29950 [Actinosynnema sp. NPDC023658]|uniref:hypothetical protein n=1 Tax=Actinosynnema sp. NPDC023658 TaxID=3155465 RepID=UPI0033DCB64A